MKEALDEMEKVLATADPERVSEECIVLNVEGDCLDHLEWVPGNLSSSHLGSDMNALFR